MPTIAAGWVIDTGDPSVGIFGTEAIHETCPEWDDELSVIGDDKWVTMGIRFVPRNGYTEMVIRRRITCHCGSVEDVYDHDVGWMAEEAYA